MQHTLLFLSIIIIVFGQSSFSQFQWVNPKPQGNTLLAVDFPSPSTGFAAGECGTIMKTIDGGYTWSILASGVTANLNAICMTDTLHGFAAGDSGVLISTFNGGLTWTRHTGTPLVTLNAVCFSSPLVGMTGGLKGTMLRTADGGNTWQQIILPVVSGIYDICFPSADTGYAVGGGGTSGGKGFILKSTDAGSSWTLLSDTIPQSLYTIEFKTPGKGYIAGNSGFIAKTNDGAQSIEVLDFPGPDYAHIRAVGFYNDTVGLTCDWSFHIRRTTDGGKTWQDTGIPSTNAICALDLQNENSFCSVGYGGSICLSDNRGDSVASLLKGNSSELKRILRAGNAIYIFGNEVMMRSYDEGSTWVTDSLPGSQYFADAEFLDADNGYVLLYNGFLKTTDGGRNWTWLPLPSRANWLSELYMTNIQTGFICGGGLSPGGSHWATLERTDNGGQSWIPMTVPASYSLNRIVFPTPQTGFVAGDNGMLLRTQDHGATWESRPVPAYSYADICFPSTDTGFLLGTNQNDHPYIIRSTDGGDSWLEISSLPVQTYILRMSFINSNTGYITGAKGMLYKTTDGGINWSCQMPVTKNNLYDLLLTHESGGYLVGAMGTVLAYGDVPYAVPEDRSTADFSVFPNPFISELNIRLPVGASGKILFEWHDLSGRLFHQNSLSVIPGTATAKISVPPELPFGFYLLSVTHGQGRSVFKAIKSE